MNTELQDDDTSDNDCFIVEEIKPVKKLISRKPTTIKTNNTSNNLISKRSKNNKKKDKVRKASATSDDIKLKKRQATLTEITKTSKKKFSNFTTRLDNTESNELISIVKDVFSDGRKNNSIGMSDYEVKQDKKVECYTIELEDSQDVETLKTGSPSKAVNASVNFESVKTKKKQSSPKIFRRRKRFIMGEFAVKSISHEKNIRKSLIEMFDTVEENTNSPIKEEGITESGKISDNSELLSFIVKDMIRAETKKHSNLLLENEREILDKFFNLQESACRVFVRMLGRKKSWHRVCDIVYKDIGTNLENEFEILHKENYVDTEIEEEDLRTQMNLLKKPEVLNLCKAFNVFLKFNVSSRKEDLINSLIQECQKQKSALDMFKGNNSRLDRLKCEVKKCLGMCIKLNSATFLTFHKILFLASFPHYHDEEDQRFTSELQTRSQVIKKQIKFPAYKVSPVVVFETLEDFELYKKAVLLLDSIEIATVNKDYEEFCLIFTQVKEEFQKLIENQEYQKRFSNLKPFLRKFSAGTIYAKILSICCTNFKKKVENSEIRNTAELLLNQNIFLTSKRGEWYEILSIALKNQKQNNEAAEVIIRGLKDPHINEIQKLTLQLRGLLILKVQSNGVKDGFLRNSLSKLCESTIQEPASIEIKGKAMPENELGHRCVYVEESGDGKRYTSVEERAISHYKVNGFPKGYHTEGLIIQSIYFLLFYDIIYGISVEGVFLTPFQEAPLDFNSSLFYESRKEEIDLLLSDMSSWDHEEVEAKIRDSYYRNYGTTCLITWSDELTPELFCEVVKCITMPILVLILQRLVRNFRRFRSGFPDLTLWNPETNKCKFVEVKSPTDRLSPNQRVWLDFLKNIGLDCEVCNVKNVSGKNFG